MVRTLTCAFCSYLVTIGWVSSAAAQFGGRMGADWGGYPPTLSRQLLETDAAYIVRCVSHLQLGEKFRDDGEENEEEPLPSIEIVTRFEVVEAWKPGGPNLPRGTIIEFNDENAAKRGELYLLFGMVDGYEEADEKNQRVEQIEWSLSEQVTAATCRYLRQAPRLDLWQEEGLPSERWKYFARFLEDADDVIAEDAFQELEQASHEDLAQIAEFIPRERLRNWFRGDAVEEHRLRLYGILLGLCGASPDAKLLEEHVLRDWPEEDHYGLEGAVIGYLLLSGQAGLDRLEEALRSKPEPAVINALAVQNGLTYLQTHAPHEIGSAHLRESQLRLLEYDFIAELVIADLARQHDWTALERIVPLYDRETHQRQQIKVEIFRYLLSCSAAKPDGSASPSSVTAARQLVEFGKRDPELLREAKRGWNKLR